MARPRKDQRGPDARTRIVDAFWGMLAEGPYADITVRALASRARVNHNTIYRHFDSIDDVAKEAILEVYSAETARRMFELFASPDSVDVGSLSEWGLDESFDKVLLAVRSGSPTLMALVTEGVKTSWMRITGTSWGELSDEARLELSFILGGVTATLRTFSSADDVMKVKALVTSRTGAAARKTLVGLGSENHSTCTDSGRKAP